MFILDRVLAGKYFVTFFMRDRTSCLKCGDWSLMLYERNHRMISNSPAVNTSDDFGDSTMRDRVRNRIWIMQRIIIKGDSGF